MEKSWLKSVEGKESLADVAHHDTASLVISELGKNYLGLLCSKLLENNYKTDSAQQELILARAELEGARNMLKSILSDLESAKKKRQ